MPRVGVNPGSTPGRQPRRRKEATRLLSGAKELDEDMTGRWPGG